MVARNQAVATHPPTAAAVAAPPPAQLVEDGARLVRRLPGSDQRRWHGLLRDRCEGRRGAGGPLRESFRIVSWGGQASPPSAHRRAHRLTPPHTCCLQSSRPTAPTPLRASSTSPSRPSEAPNGAAASEAAALQSPSSARRPARQFSFSRPSCPALPFCLPPSNPCDENKKFVGYFDIRTDPPCDQTWVRTDQFTPAV